MLQTLEAQVSIRIPPEYVVISKDEYDRLINSDDIGQWWTLKDVLSRINRQRSWFMENVINNPRYRKQLDVRRGGFVKYSTGGKDGYLFLASKTKLFLEENFSEILKED